MVIATNTRINIYFFNKKYEVLIFKKKIMKNYNKGCHFLFCPGHVILQSVAFHYPLRCRLTTVGPGTVAHCILRGSNGIGEVKWE